MSEEMRASLQRRLVKPLADFLALVCGASFTNLVTAAELSLWTPDRSIEMTYYLDPDALDGVPFRAGGIFRSSPDGRRVFYVTRRGDLACDCNVYELVVHDYARLSHALKRGQSRPEPVGRVSLRSSSNRPAIQNARWADDEHVAFLGAEDERAAQIFRFTVSAGALEKWSSAPSGVFGFDARGDAAIYLAYLDSSRRTELDQYPASFVDGYKFGIALGIDKVNAWATFARSAAGETRQVGPTRTEVLPGAFQYWIAPGGRYAVMMNPISPTATPPHWFHYVPFPQDRLAGVSARLQEGEAPRAFRRYELVDLRSGRATPMLNAPTGAAIFSSSPAPKAIWSEDGSRVVLVNTMLPLGEDPARSSTSFVVEYEVASGTWRTVVPIPPRSAPGSKAARIDSIRWGTSRELLVTRAGESAAEVSRYALRSDRWIPSGRSPPEREGDGGPAVRLELVQSVNDPPSVVAVGRSGRITVSTEDPALRNVVRLPVEPVEWQAQDEVAWHGGLVRPIAGAGRAAPLVIQVHRFEPDKFLPDGGFYSGFAAQSLAAHGYAVLTMNMMDVRGMGTSEEGESFVAGLDAAVALLAERGVIDAARVGLVGFSRGGYLTQYAIANPGVTRISAAVSFDGADGSYVQYLLYALSSPASAEFVPQYANLYAPRGGFWANQDSWIQRAPGFNADRVKTPLLLSIGGAGTDRLLIWAMEMFGGLRLNRAPVELLFFPEGEHVRQRPLERRVAMESTIDWLSFWMRGVVDPAQHKKEQYRRWNELRERTAPSQAGMP
jgi:dienelactone hydrolase